MRFELPFRLIFIRHGETDWNVAARLQGNRDIPMNALGPVQAVQAGRRVAALLAGQRSRLDALFYVSSPLGRAQQTMQLVRAAIDLPPEPYATDPRLAEIAFGQWQGKTWPEIEAVDPDGAKAYHADKWGCVPPQGESYAMLAERLRGWLETLDRETLVVSHGGVARALMPLIGGADTTDAPNASIVQGRLLIFEHGHYRWV
jgi:broad specificity phosphatase PhoE